MGKTQCLKGEYSAWDLKMESGQLQQGVQGGQVLPVGSLQGQPEE